jgi:hypothetical protein
MFFFKLLNYGKIWPVKSALHAQFYIKSIVMTSCVEIMPQLDSKDAILKFYLFSEVF